MAEMERNQQADVDESEGTQSDSENVDESGDESGLELAPEEPHPKAMAQVKGKDYLYFLVQ